MPTNVGVHYLKAEEEYHEAEGTPEKLKALRKMLATAPTHKGCERLRKDIKERIKRFKYKHETEKKTSKGYSSSIKKEGAAQIVFIGVPNAGKSTLLSKLSGKKIKVAEYKFTTKKPVVKMIPYENVWLQGIEIPAMYLGFSESKKGRQFMSHVRNSDFVVLVIKEKGDRLILREELGNVGIILSDKKGRKGLDQMLPHMVVEWKDFDKDLAKRLWEAQGKIRVQTRTRDKIAKKPIVFPVGANVEDVTKKVHKDFLKKFRFAKIWGPSAKFKGQQVGLEHVLKDTDIVEIFLK